MSERCKQLCSAEEAVAAVPGGATLACSGFVGAGHPEALSAALEQRFLNTGAPRNLTLVYAAGQGDGKKRGLNHLAHEGLLKRVIGGHWGLCPELGRLALDGRIEAWNLPQGVLCHLFRDIAAGRPGTVTDVGLGTFIDPLNDGGRLSDKSDEQLVERIEIRGRQFLLYHSFPIHAAFIRATAADPWGNLVMDREAVIGDVLPLAQAAHNHGGPVIAQVEQLLDGPCPPQAVRVPGCLVSHLVIAPPAQHWQTFGTEFQAEFHSAERRASPDLSAAAAEIRSDGKDARRIIAERAARELRRGDIVNLGIGLPEGIAEVAQERGLLQRVTLTVESGPIGGKPAGGLDFGAAWNPRAIIDQPSQFDFYDGGGLDFAALGAAEVDAEGNVNVSRFGSRFAGVGGFVNISQKARRLVFCGTFTTGGLDVCWQKDGLKIRTEGSVAKFVKSVQQISFSGRIAAASDRDVLFVTERAVFRLTTAGLELIEIAPGIDLERDVFAQMGFRPIVNRPALMTLSGESE